MSAPPLPAAGPFSVLVLITSGPLQEAAAVLADLPAPLPVPVLIATSEEYEGATAELEGHVIQEARHGTDLIPGHLYLASPKGVLELQPRFHCTVTPDQPSAPPHPLDQLLTSLARSAGQGVLVVVLGGQGPDRLGPTGRTPDGAGRRRHRARRADGRRSAALARHAGLLPSPAGPGGR